MNCNLYLNDELFQELEQYRKLHNKSRNSIITEALKMWLDARKEKEWPKEFFAFSEESKDPYPEIKDQSKETQGLKKAEF